MATRQMHVRKTAVAIDSEKLRIEPSAVTPCLGSQRLWGKIRKPSWGSILHDKRDSLGIVNLLEQQCFKKKKDDVKGVRLKENVCYIYSPVGLLWSDKPDVAQTQPNVWE